MTAFGTAARELIDSRKHLYQLDLGYPTAETVQNVAHSAAATVLEAFHVARDADVSAVESAYINAVADYWRNHADTPDEYTLWEERQRLTRGRHAEIPYSDFTAFLETGGREETYGSNAAINAARTLLQSPEYEHGITLAMSVAHDVAIALAGKP